MADTLTIRLDKHDRAILERAARSKGTGLSGFVRQLAESEAKRLRQEAIKREFDEVVKYIAEQPEARGELDLLGTPISEPLS